MCPVGRPARLDEKAPQLVGVGDRPGDGTGEPVRTHRVDRGLEQAGLALELIALIVLRVKRPQMARPFRVPGGRIGLALAVVLPMLVIAIVAWAGVKDEAARTQLMVVTGLILSGPVVYVLRRRFAAARQIEEAAEKPDLAVER